jgi:dihydrofolate reductase
MSAVVAMDKNGTIGVGNELPWYCSKDLQKFKQLTVGKVCIFGRKTFDSLKLENGLPNRLNIVVTNSSDELIKNSLRHIDEEPNIGVVYVRPKDIRLNAENLHGFTYHLREMNTRGCNIHPEIMICGGSKLYEMFEYKIDRVYLTEFQQQLVDPTTTDLVKFPYDLKKYRKLLAAERSIFDVAVGKQQLQQVETVFSIYQ